MKVIRQLVYEFDNQEDLDRQISGSIADGIKNIPFNGDRHDTPVRGTITIRTLLDERVVVDLYPHETIAAGAGVVASAFPVTPPAIPVPCQCGTCQKVRAKLAKLEESQAVAEQAQMAKEVEQARIYQDYCARCSCRHSPEDKWLCDTNAAKLHPDYCEFCTRIHPTNEMCGPQDDE